MELGPWYIKKHDKCTSIPVFMNEAKQGSSNTRVALGFTAPLHF